MLKTVSSITNAIGALNYKGTWNATTNTPDLAALTAAKGDYYVVSVAGSTSLGGISTWYVGDWAVYNGAVWQRVEGGEDDPAPSVRSNSSTGVLQVTGPAAGTTRVMTTPDANFTAARTDAGQTFSGTQNFYGANSNFGDTANTARSLFWVRNSANVGDIGTSNSQLTISNRLCFSPSDTSLVELGMTGVTPTDGHRFRLSNWKTTVGAGEKLGTIEWYSNDASSGGAGVRATVAAIENDGGTGRSYDLAFGTGAAATATVKCRVRRDGHFVPEADDTYSLGVDGLRWSAVWAANGTIQTSDERKKTSIAESDLGLNFVMALRPVSYKWISGGKVAVREPDGFEEVILEPEVTDAEGNVVSEAKTGTVEKFKEVLVDRPGQRTHYGLLAQQVKEVIGEKDFGGFVYSEESDTFGVRYDQFISPMIKAIQELKAQIDVLQSEINSLKGV
jgi:hypothetical protein